MLALVTGACAKAPPPTPEETYSHFIQHLSHARAGEESPLMEDFDTPTREALTQRATVAAQAMGAHLPADPIPQLLQGPPPQAPTAIKVTEQSEDRAVLQVDVDAGPSGPVVLVREAGRWRIHLDLGATK
jgi:hypothetical protein